MANVWKIFRACRVGLCAACCAAVLGSGCGKADPPPNPGAKASPAKIVPQEVAKAPAASIAGKKPAIEEKPNPPSRSNERNSEGRPPRRSLADLVPEDAKADSLTPSPPTSPAVERNPRVKGLGSVFAAGQPPATSLPDIDADRIVAVGLRKLEGRHLILYTDLPSQPEIDELPAIFDQAVPQWAAYFELPQERWKDWRVVGSLMQAKERFERAGLLFPGLPPFTQGFQAGFQLWLYEQATPYYRRHLLLHEGTHAVLNTLVGGSGPPWYSEGVSELLSTHRWHEGRLTLRTVPKHRDDAPGWGRIKIIRDDFAAERGKRLEDVMQYGPDAHLHVEPYGWCWAACYFLDSHPKSQAVFRAMRSDVRDTSLDFSRRLHQQLHDDWSDLTEDWQVFLANAEYGYDIERNCVERKPGESLPETGVKVKLKVDRGWQSTGWQVEANRGYEFVASGKFRIVAEPEEWLSEPGGVTLRYHKGQPLGMLLAAIRPDITPLGKVTALATPDEIGLGRRAVMERTGTLYLRINDAPGELADNQGEVIVEIRPVRIGK